MRTREAEYKLYSGHLCSVYKYRDKRIKFQKVIPLDYDNSRHNGIMLYLCTAVIIGLLTLFGMAMIDIYHSNLRNQIEAEYLSNSYHPQSSNRPDDIVRVIYHVADYQPLPVSYQTTTTNGRGGVIEEGAAQDDIDVYQLSATQPISDGIELRSTYTPEELEFIERVVEAEVTGTSYSWNGNYVDEAEMLLAKVRVCQVFLNRVDNTSRFSNITTLYEAVSYPGASSTVQSGRYLDVEVTDLTKEAVQIALDPNTEDMTDGALFFLANGAKENKYGSYLFTDAVGHSFFK